MIKVLPVNLSLTLTHFKTLILPSNIYRFELLYKFFNYALLKHCNIIFCYGYVFI